MKYDFPMIAFVSCARLWALLRGVLRPLRTAYMCACHGIRAGSGVKFEGRVIIRTRRRGEIEFGDNVVVCSRVGSNLVGLINPCIFDTIRGGTIIVGRNSGLSATVVSSKASVKIGENVKIGGNVRIFDHDFHALECEKRRGCGDVGHTRAKPIVIEDDVFVGTNAIILKGTHIGARSIVAAGSVVFGLDIPEDALVKGNPAVIVGSKRR